MNTFLLNGQLRPMLFSISQVQYLYPIKGQFSFSIIILEERIGDGFNNSLALNSMGAVCLNSKLPFVFSSIFSYKIHCIFIFKLCCCCFAYSIKQIMSFSTVCLLKQVRNILRLNWQTANVCEVSRFGFSKRK